MKLWIVLSTADPDNCSYSSKSIQLQFSNRWNNCNTMDIWDTIY